MNLTKREEAELQRLRRKWLNRTASTKEMLRAMSLQRKRDHDDDRVAA